MKTPHIKLDLTLPTEEELEAIREKVAKNGPVKNELGYVCFSACETIEVGDINECEHFIELKIYYRDPNIIEMWIDGKYWDEFKTYYEVMKEVKKTFSEMLIEAMG